MKQLVLIAHNLRSTYNVGSLLRTAEGLGVTEVIFTGYTPYPEVSPDDPRLPHERQKIAKAINKVALDAEYSQPWRHADIADALTELRNNGYTIAALEQAEQSVSLAAYAFPDKLAVILGREVEGVEPAILAECDEVLEIPMAGHKESFNVVQAAAMLGYQWRFFAN